MAVKTAYYSEIDPHAAQWLRNLIAVGVLAPGIVDERDIRDVKPDDLKDFAQCHFFAGIGVWSYALRQAGWEGSRGIWTGSCPCQSFSAAGKRAGFADERHLWPAFFHLIEICRPPVVIGEQVASKDGLAWIDLVHADLEAADYACGAFDLCAAGVGAPQIRQRLFFVAQNVEDTGRGAAGHIAAVKWRDYDQPQPLLMANAVRATSERRAGSVLGAKAPFNRARLDDGRIADGFGDGRQDGVMAGAEGERLQRRPDDRDEGRRQRASGQGREASELGDASGAGLALGSLADERCGALRDEGAAFATPGAESLGPGPTNGYWRDADWIGCTDGKWRPVEPESFPLVDGSAFRLGSGGAFENKSRAKMLRGYGNAIVAPLAIEFIKAAMECMP